MKKIKRKWSTLLRLNCFVLCSFYAIRLDRVHGLNPLATHATHVKHCALTHAKGVCYVPCIVSLVRRDNERLIVVGPFWLFDQIFTYVRQNFNRFFKNQPFIIQFKPFLWKKTSQWFFIKFKLSNFLTTTINTHLKLHISAHTILITSLDTSITL